MPKDNDDFDYEEFWGRPPRHRQKKKRSLFLPVVAACLLVFMAVAYAAYQYSDDVLRRAAQKTANKSAGQDKGAKDNWAAILLIGADQRAKEPARADTIMVAFLDPASSKLQILSIPRDTYVQIPGRGHEKLNHAHAYGGAKLLTETVSALLDVPISKYVQVNFDAFRAVIDILGGVEYEVEKRMYYDLEGIDLYPGKQILDGDKALQYVRYRTDGDDITRIRRQQKFLGALSEQAFKVTTILKLPQMAREVYSHIKTNLGLQEMIGLAKIFLEAGSANLETVMLPGDPRYINGISYWVPSDDRTRQTVEQITNKQAALKN
ncbi:MAG: LCP family protein [Bacillota bacterium]